MVVVATGLTPGGDVDPIKMGTVSETYPGFAADLRRQGVKGAFIMDTCKGPPAALARALPGDYPP